MACDRHDLPFHRMAAWPVELTPTASQKLMVTHDTLRMFETCAGSGAGWIFQAAPFHPSARLTEFPAMSRVPPTATQNLRLTQDTEISRLLTAPSGAAICVTCQDPAASRSATGRGTPSPPKSPAASHAIAAGHEIPLRAVLLVPAGLGTRA